MKDKIATKNDIKKFTGHLVKQCEYMNDIYQKVGLPPLRKGNKGFGGLLRIIVGQQLSIASANAIWEKTQMAVPSPTAHKIQALTDAQLRQCGISRPKIKTIRALCSTITSKKLIFSRLQDMDEQLIHKNLTAIHGVGPWTADIYMMFCMGRVNAWAPGDLALQYAIQSIFKLDKKPDISQTLEYAERWKPYRSIAARLLWAYYSDEKENKKVIPI